MNTQNLTVNISLAGEIDMKKLAQEFDKALRAEIDRVGINVEVGSKKEPLKVGDYAKVVLETHYLTGEIVKIVSDNYSEFYKYDTAEINGEEGDCFEPEHLVKATDEEVADAKKKQAEAKAELRWKAIGRKPNEFKQGDIVRITRYQSAAKEGELVELTYAGGVVTYGGGYGADRDAIELVTPVEQRFDLGGDNE